VAAKRRAEPPTRAAVLAAPRLARIDFGRFAPSGRSLWVGLGLLAIALGAYAAGRETSLFAIRRIELVGATPAVAGQVRQAVRDFQGASLVGLNGAELLRQVESVPTVASAGYDRGFPHTLKIVVRPEQAVGVLRAGRRSWLASARGRVIARLPLHRRPDLPRFWLPSATQIELGAILENGAGTSARSLAPLGRAGFPARIKTVGLKHEELVYSLGSGIQLRLGRPVDLHLKLAIARRILPRLPGGTAYLDVSVPERPVAGPNTQVSG
jgi:cell division protein FtsQ